MQRLIAFVMGGLLLVLTTALASSSGVQAFIQDTGVHVPTTDVLRDYAFGLAWAGLLGLSILAWPTDGRKKWWLMGAWLAKCGVALGVMLPYEERYGGLDCWFYFRNAHTPLGDIPAKLARGGGDLVEALGAVQVNLGPDSYHAVKLSFAMLGFIAIYLLYRAAELLLGRPSPMAFWVLTLYPTILFWSSIYGKDPVVLLGIAIYVWGIAHLSMDRNAWYIVPVLAGVALASIVRVWMGPILLLPCLLVVLARIRNLMWRWVAVVILAGAVVPLATATMDRLAIDDATDLLQATRAVKENFGDANSGLDRQVELNSMWDLVAFAPQGLFDTYFRPLPGDVDNTFGLLAGIENVLLLCVSVWAATRFRFAYLRNPVFFWSIALLLTWGLAYSLVTYRDLGTAVRFKLQILPVLLGVIGFLIRRRRARVVEPGYVPTMRVERVA
jgi:hypothetical protein